MLSSFAFYLKNSYCCPKKGIKVLSITNSCFRITKLAPKQVHTQNAEKKCTHFTSKKLPEDEDKEHEKPKEYSNIIHGSEHHYQLSPEIWQKSNKFHYSEKSKCP